MIGRNYFRFSLRTIFIITTVFCLLFAYVAYEINWITQRKAFLASPDYLNPFGNESVPYNRRGPLLSRYFDDLHYDTVAVPIKISTKDYVRDPFRTTNNHPLVKRAKVLFPEAKIMPVVIGPPTTNQGWEPSN
jgi:hypothetical protein